MSRMGFYTMDVGARVIAVASDLPDGCLLGTVIRKDPQGPIYTHLTTVFRVQFDEGPCIACLIGHEIRPISLVGELLESFNRTGTSWPAG